MLTLTPNSGVPSLVSTDPLITDIICVILTVPLFL